MTATYEDRAHAGRLLARELLHLRGEDVVVLAIPNGGVEVAVPVARALRAPLGLLLVSKIQIPGNTEAGFGAVAQDGTTVFNRALLERLGLGRAQIEAQKAAAVRSLEQRAARYGRWAEIPELAGRVVVLVDDGLASGSTMEAAVGVVRQRAPKRVVVAAPTASGRAMELLARAADEVIAPNVGRGPVFAVAEAYTRWYDVGTEEVLSLLRTATKPVSTVAGPG